LTITEGKAIGWEPNDLWDKALSDQPTSVYLPIMLENEPLGVLYLTMRGKRGVAPSARQVIDSLVNHSAVILLRDKLMRSQARTEALAEADKLKTALLSMVSHDFRSPLTSIKASVSSLLQDGEPIDAETQRSLLMAADQETDRLNKMVGNILDFSRLEAGAWKPRYEAVDLAEVVGSALDSLNERENNRIQVHLDAHVPEVNVDPVQMVQVLKNLLENALKYSPELSPVDLNISCMEEKIAIEVLDRGSGLPKGDEERIFESFYRAPALKESAVPGVGLGLALCKGLVEANGGSLRASNREGGGATFRISLAANAASYSEPHQSDDRRGPHTQAQAPGIQSPEP
jgi:two-component system sensor histidine kinase KdpD